MSPDESHSKLQRWTDLIAALLSRKLGGTFTELARDVPGYVNSLRERSQETVKRMSEVRAKGARWAAGRAEVHSWS